MPERGGHILSTMAHPSVLVAEQLARKVHSSGSLGQQCVGRACPGSFKPACGVCMLIPCSAVNSAWQMEEGHVWLHLKPTASRNLGLRDKASAAAGPHLNGPRRDLLYEVQHLHAQQLLQYATGHNLQHKENEQAFHGR